MRSAILLEVIVQSLADAREAARGGADRLEVVREIDKAGLTPAPELVRAIAAEVGLPLRVMVRENDGFTTTDREMAELQSAAAAFAEMGVDGLVAGFERDGVPLLDDLSKLLEAAPGVPVTFHRAFDRLRDPVAALDRLAAVPQIDRVLTDGGPGSPDARCARLQQYAARAERLTFVAGGGVDLETFGYFAKLGCVREIHVGRAAREHDQATGPVSAARVRRLRELAG